MAQQHWRSSIFVQEPLSPEGKCVVTHIVSYVCQGLHWTSSLVRKDILYPHGLEAHNKHFRLLEAHWTTSQDRCLCSANQPSWRAIKWRRNHEEWYQIYQRVWKVAILVVECSSSLPCFLYRCFFIFPPFSEQMVTLLLRKWNILFSAMLTPPWSQSIP